MWRANTVFLKPLPRVCSAKSKQSAARPKSWSAMTRAFSSVRLNCLDREAAITTGNSRPLERWMLIIRTEFPLPTEGLASPKSVS